MQIVEQLYQQRMREIQQARQAQAAAASQVVRQPNNQPAFSPRAGYNSGGYSNGTGYSYDENQRQGPSGHVNRVYYWDGSSRPIGQGDGVVRVRQQASSTAAATNGQGARYVYDENQPQGPSGHVNRVYYWDGSSRPIGQTDGVVRVRQQANSTATGTNGQGARYSYDENKPSGSSNRINRGYSTDGTARPIGQGNDVAAIRPQATSTNTGTYGQGARYSYDENQPRSTPSVSVPAVSPRQTGVPSQTAALVMP